MKRSLILLVLACALTLPGCMVVGAAVGVGGYALGGPAQYASTALSLCEYGYELAVNEKTPDAVLKDKILTVIDILDGPDYLGPWETGLDSPAPVALASADLDSLSQAYGVAALPQALPGDWPLPVPALAPEEMRAPTLLAQAAPAPAPARPAPASAAPAVPAFSAPAASQSAPVLTDWPTLAQADPAPASGDWSLRLPVSGVTL